MLKVGDKLPNKSAPNQEDKMVNLHDFLGKPLIVFFYPKANTSGCTVEVNNLNDNLNELEKVGNQIVGVSADPVSANKKFHDSNHLKYDLLSDEKKEIINAFGVWGPKKMYGREYEGIYRATFIFDEKGICTRVIDKVKTKDAAAQILNT